MASKKKGLGKGLSAMLSSEKLDTNKSNINDIELSEISVNPFQPRSNFSNSSLIVYSISIKNIGIIQPITVRKIEKNKYQLISGERRLRACKEIGLKNIPAFVRKANDQNMLEYALVENIQREDLNAIEIALSYERLLTECALTQEELSDKIAKSRSNIANYLRLLKLDPILQTGMRDGFISMGHGRALINVKSSEDQLAIYEKILREKLSVRQTEELVKSLKVEATVPNEIKKHIPKYIKDGLLEINSYLGHNINITVNSKGKGKISIPFHSQEDFERIKKIRK